MKKWVYLLSFLLVTAALAQPVPLDRAVVVVSSAPSGSCTTATAPVQIVRTTGRTWYCAGGTWTQTYFDYIRGGVYDVDSWDLNIKKNVDNGRVGIKAKNTSSVTGAKAEITAAMEVTPSNAIGIGAYGPNYTAPYGGHTLLAASGVSAKLFFGTVGTARAVLDTAGRFGIGPTFVSASPTTVGTTLDVDGDFRVTYGGNQTYFSGAQINFSRSGANYIWADGTLGSFYFGTGGRPHDSGNYSLFLNGTTKDAIFAGMVGIGGYYPTYPLDVNGSARVTGNLFIGGALGFGQPQSSYVSLLHGTYNSSYAPTMSHWGGSSRNSLIYADRMIGTTVSTVGSAGITGISGADIVFHDTTEALAFTLNSATDTLVLTIQNTSAPYLPLNVLSNGSGWATYVEQRSLGYPKPQTVTTAFYCDQGSGLQWYTANTTMAAFPDSGVPRYIAPITAGICAPGYVVQGVKWTLTDWSGYTTPTIIRFQNFGIMHLGEDLWTGYVHRGMDANRFPMVAPLAVKTNYTSPPLILGANNQGQKVVGLDADTVDGLSSSAFAPQGLVNGHVSALYFSDGTTGYTTGTLVCNAIGKSCNAAFTVTPSGTTGNCSTTYSSPFYVSCIN